MLLARPQHARKGERLVCVPFLRTLFEHSPDQRFRHAVQRGGVRKGAGDRVLSGLLAEANRHIPPAVEAGHFLQEDGAAVGAAIVSPVPTKARWHSLDRQVAEADRPLAVSIEASGSTDTDGNGRLCRPDRERQPVSVLIAVDDRKAIQPQQISKHRTARPAAGKFSSGDIGIKQLGKPLCIYHENCADGFTAAWIINRALKGEVDFYAGIYGAPPPDVAGRDVILVDFSYKRHVLVEMLQTEDVKQANTILVLDHHKTAAEDLKGLLAPGDGFYESDSYRPDCWRVGLEQLDERPVRAIFDMERSGAQLAWDFFVSHMPRPPLVDYVGDHELWRFALPLSREINAYISAYEYRFGEWDHLDRQMRNQMDVQDVADLGGAIERKRRKDVAELVRVCRRTMVIGGHTVPVANIPYTLTSDAGHLMAKGEPFAACYWDTPNGRVFSLRSTDEGLDVSLIAETYGGGGLRNASGFQRPVGWEGDQQASADPVFQPPVTK